ncbi:MAG: DUF3854 domain-containing protein [Methylacidiphilales bacterium]|nr:DUF3854 domain-containing protein [Candidatus Methylacidiphilales bacterium]
MVTQIASQRQERPKTEIPEAVWAEFQQSAISEELTATNIHWLQGKRLLEELIGSATTGHQYATREIQKLITRYEKHCEAGGWACWGVTLAGEPGNTPVIKLAKPRVAADGKAIKYETPVRAPGTPILPIATETCIQKVEARFNVKLPRDVPFWRAIQNADVPICVTEGVKKALALLEQGIPAVAIRGVCMWHPKSKKELYPEIAAFCHSGRTCYIAFDYDSKPTSRASVTKQAVKLGRAIERLGARPLYMRWSDAKGIDDYLALFDPAQRWLVATRLLQDALPLARYRRIQIEAEAKLAIPQIRQDNAFAASYHNGRVANLAATPNQILAIRAPIGSGKSTEIARIAANWKTQSTRSHKHLVLVLSPRNALGRQLASKLNIPHIHDYAPYDFDALDRDISARHGIALCPDSLHRLPSWIWKNQNILLILDEANQVVRHTIFGDTLNAKWRSHVSKFVELCKNAKAIIAAEAELPNHSLAFLSQTSRKPVKLVQFQGAAPDPWHVILYDYSPNHRAIFDEQLLLAATAEPTLIVSSSKTYLETLDALLTGLKRKVIRIDSDTNELGIFASFFEDPDTWLQQNQPDVLLLSPSAESGVSIEANIPAQRAYFKSVWGYFPALSPDTALQMLGRYRPSVPRHIFVPESTPHADLEGPKPYAIRARLRYLAEALAQIHQVPNPINPDETQTAIESYIAHEKALQFHTKSIFKVYLIESLERQGHIVSRHAHGQANPAIRQAFKMEKNKLQLQKAHQFATIEIDPNKHTSEWASHVLENYESSAHDRITAIKALRFHKFPRLRKHLDDPNFVHLAYYENRGRLENQAEWRTLAEFGKLIKHLEREKVIAILTNHPQATHKLPKKAIMAAIISEIGLLGLLNQPYSNEHPKAQEIAKQALKWANEIWHCWRLQIKDSQTPCEIINKLFRRLGIVAVEMGQKRRPGNKKIRIWLAQDPLAIPDADPDKSPQQQAYSQLVLAWREHYRAQLAPWLPAPPPPRPSPP